LVSKALVSSSGSADAGTSTTEAVASITGSAGLGVIVSATGSIGAGAFSTGGAGATASIAGSGFFCFWFFT